MRNLKRLTLAIALSLIASGAYAGNPIAGKKVWESHSCPTCHGIDGNSPVPGVPSFAKGDDLVNPDSVLLQTITTGKGLMPSWQGVLSRQDMIDVVTYIRTLRN